MAVCARTCRQLLRLDWKNLDVPSNKISHFDSSADFVMVKIKLQRMRFCGGFSLVFKKILLPWRNGTKSKWTYLSVYIHSKNFFKHTGVNVVTELSPFTPVKRQHTLAKKVLYQCGCTTIRKPITSKYERNFQPLVYVENAKFSVYVETLHLLYFFFWECPCTGSGYGFL